MRYKENQDGGDTEAEGGGGEHFREAGALLSNAATVSVSGSPRNAIGLNCVEVCQ